MSKPLYLPHSARQKYSHCPRLYYLYYRERLRPTELSSVLLFGTAIDRACENYLLERVPLRAKEIFKQNWKEQEEDGKTIHLAETSSIKYAAADLDVELLLQSDNEYILKDTVYETVSDLVKAGADKERIAYAYWISLYRKGIMLVDKFIEWVDENVEEVLGCQVPIELEDEEGNKVPGLADFVLRIYGYNKPILIDLKTSARYYDRGSVKESEQLALYYFYLKQTKFPDMERAAYLVLNKQIKKNRKKTCRKCGHVTTGREQACAEGGKGKSRCNGDFDVDISPEVVLQYIHDEIPQSFIDATIEKFNVAKTKIKAEKFEPCWTGCENYFGRRCPMWKFCHEDGNMEGLIKKEKKSEA